MHFENPTPFQMQAIPIILEERSFTAMGASGGGKTYGLSLSVLLRAMQSDIQGTFCIVTPGQPQTNGILNILSQLTSYLKDDEVLEGVLPAVVNMKDV